MSIFPLPVFEADADPSRRSAMTDAEVYARLKPPTSIVVRIGAMRWVAEFPYNGDSKPGCGSKLVARTWRGTEIVEMLTTTCGNSGCSKSVSRSEMLEYIEQSGGRDFPFRTDGQILRVATAEDLSQWARVQAAAKERVPAIKRIVEASHLPMKVVDVEPVLGQELLTIYFLSEERVDFRELVRQLASELHARIELRQIGARDEARLVADYERCGQHCCCKQFLKVLKPISMRSAKTQKATLDPLKISGRCGRLMCCLRYEDQTYEDLKKRLPKNKSRVGTAEGPGIVVDSKILVQLVLVQLEHDGREIAVPVEELLDPDTCPRPGAVAAASMYEPDPLRGMSPESVARRTDDRQRAERGDRNRPEQQDRFRASSKSVDGADERPSDDAKVPPTSGTPAVPPSGPPTENAPDGEERRKRRRRRRRKGSARPDGAAPREHESAGDASDESMSSGAASGASGGDADAHGDSSSSDASEGAAHADPNQPHGHGKRRRRRRRRRGGDGGATPPAPSA
ncbi:MAG: regulatory iron-sulfur-containing complex subunit RicT [Phycisphaerales bacterium]